MQLQIDPTHFFRLELADKIAFLNGALGQRLSSRQVAEVLQRIASMFLASPHAEHVDERRTLAELLQLDPYGKRPALWDKLFPGGPSHVGVVTLVLSCDKYLAKAKPLYAALHENFQPLHIVTADPTLKQARFDGNRLIVPTRDDYESLPRKVLEAILAVRQRYGTCAVLKVDDDTNVIAPPDIDAFAALARSADYAGQAVGFNGHDRCWHAGKCHDPSRNAPYTKRFLTAWARGAFYYLGTRAVDTLVADYLAFPDEVATEVFEDKMIGDMLHHRGVKLSNVDIGSIFGLFNEPVDPTTRSAR